VGRVIRHHYDKGTYQIKHNGHDCDRKLYTANDGGASIENIVRRDREQ
jgi:hypothetical protein